jgi:hypothetical protein
VVEDGISYIDIMLVISRGFAIIYPITGQVWLRVRIPG